MTPFDQIVSQCRYIHFEPLEQYFIATFSENVGLQRTSAEDLIETLKVTVYHSVYI